MTEDPALIDTGKCPLCGQPNDCAVAAGCDPESCWCMMVTMSSTALASIPAEALGRACICARCANTTAQDE